MCSNCAVCQLCELFCECTNKIAIDALHAAICVHIYSHIHIRIKRWSFACKVTSCFATVQTTVKVGENAGQQILGAWSIQIDLIVSSKI